MSNLDYNSSVSRDSRAHARTPVRHRLSYDWYTLDGHKLGAGFGMSLNMSAGGMLLETDKPLEVMTSVLVEIASPLYMFMATGHVVHLHPTPDGAYQIGVRFHDVIQGGWELATEIGRTGQGAGARG